MGTVVFASHRGSDNTITGNSVKSSWWSQLMGSSGNKVTGNVVGAACADSEECGPGERCVQDFDNDRSICILTNCIDSDNGGHDPLVRGRTTINLGQLGDNIYEDFCIGNTVRKYECFTTPPNNAWWAGITQAGVISCSQGTCGNGVCLKRFGKGCQANAECLSNNCKTIARRGDLHRNTCIECSSNNDCIGVSGKPKCNTGGQNLRHQDTCVECLSDNDCSGRRDGKIKCDETGAGARFICKACTTNAECAQGQVCTNAGRCQAPRAQRRR